MKIGLVLFGHLRSFRSTHGSFEQFIKILQRSGDVDVFCHTWDIEESVTTSWWKENKPGDIPPATVNATEIEEKYKPLRYTIEPSRQFDDSGYNIKSTIPVAGILSMLHSQQQAFELLQQYSSENNITYDVVIKSRYDLLYEIAPVFSNTINDCITNNCLYLPTSNPYELSGSFSDVFVLGPAKLVSEYFSFVTNFRSATEQYHQSGYRRFLPELCLTTYLQKNNISLRELTGLRVQILRMNGEKFQINTDKNFEANGPLCFYRDTIERNRELFPKQKNDLSVNTERLVKKYMSWVDTGAGINELQSYVDFYNGQWIVNKSINGLDKSGKGNRICKPNVMKNFFEESMRNAKYGSLKKLLLAFFLYRHSGYGIFFFRVWKNKT